MVTIFDCDGTLVDSEGLANDVLVDMVAEFGLSMPRDEALAEFRGGKMADCVAAVEARLGRSLPSEFVPALRARTAQVFQSQLRPIDGAVDLISAATGPMCVASNGPREKIELSLSLTGLLPFFEGRIFSAYEVGSWKPEPDLLLHAAQAMGAEPAACALVEDSLPGMRAGIAAGMKVFAFQPDGINPDVPEGVVVIERLAELRQVLGAER